MISLLEGILAEKGVSSVVVLTGGVGYLVSVPQSALAALPAVGEGLRLYTHLHVREDTLQLFGFVTPTERWMFEKLITVNGVGPRVALSILGSMSVERLVVAVESGQLGLFNRIPGVGKKTAERIILELKGKLGEVSALEAGQAAAVAGAGPQGEEAVAALIALGYSRAQAERAVAKAVEGAAGIPATTELVRRALTQI